MLNLLIPVIGTLLDKVLPDPMVPKLLPYIWDKALDEETGKWYTLSF